MTMDFDLSVYISNLFLLLQMISLFILNLRFDSRLIQLLALVKNAVTKGYKTIS